jgi:hypothetical protein
MTKQEMPAGYDEAADRFDLGSKEKTEAELQTELDQLRTKKNALSNKPFESGELDKQIVFLQSQLDALKEGKKGK